MAYDRELGRKLRGLGSQREYAPPPGTAEALKFRQAIEGAAARAEGASEHREGPRELLETIKEIAEHEGVADYPARVKADAMRVAADYVSLARPVQLALLDLVAAMKEKSVWITSLEEGEAWINQRAEFHRLGEGAIA